MEQEIKLYVYYSEKTDLLFVMPQAPKLLDKGLKVTINLGNGPFIAVDGIVYIGEL